jgi:DNA uptake protein ComE-like DNA-binding protein
MNKLSILVSVLVLTASISFAADIKVTTPAIPAKPAVPAMPAVEKKAAPAANMELIDINSAAESELKAIPLIGDEYAKKIIAGRPFSNKKQLLSKKIVPKPVYDQIKNMIIAKKPKK